jgi:hypothetical protein
MPIFFQQNTLYCYASVMLTVSINNELVSAKDESHD